MFVFIVFVFILRCHSCHMRQKQYQVPEVLDGEATPAQAAHLETQRNGEPGTLLRLRFCLSIISHLLPSALQCC